MPGKINCSNPDFALLRVLGNASYLPQKEMNTLAIAYVPRITFTFKPNQQICWRMKGDYTSHIPDATCEMKLSVWEYEQTISKHVMKMFGGRERSLPPWS